MKHRGRWPWSGRAGGAALAVAYIVAVAGTGAVARPGEAAAQAMPTQQITDCTSEYGSGHGAGNPAPGTVAYAVAQGGAWVFACGASATIPFTAALAVPAGRSVTLDAGGETLLLSGGGGAQLFTVAGSLTLTGLTLEDGSTPNGGGAIYNSGALSIDDDTFSDNQATDPGSPFSGAGGAIYNAGTAVVVGATFEDNTAAAGGLGGAVYNGGSLTVRASSFSGNTVTGASVGVEGEGGAILNDGTLVVSGSTFTSNSAVGSSSSAHPSEGGAIANDNEVVTTVTNSTFTTNSAVEGGAISNGGTLRVFGATFYSNSATGGGAIFNDTTTMTVANATFVGNSASGAAGSGKGGGAIFNGGFDFPVVVNSTFAFNGSSNGANLYGNGLTLKNTLVAAPLSSANCVLISHTYPTEQYAAVDSLESDASCGAPASGAWIEGTPQIGLLAANGGPTETVALQGTAATDPAMGAGDPAGCADWPVDGFDQRGFPRSARDGYCDIGAYQATPPPAAQPEIPAYRVAPSPIASTGSLSAGDTVALTVDAETYGGAGAPDAPVYLAFDGAGAAVADGLALSSAPQLFYTDGSGAVDVTYTATTPPAAGGTGTLTVSGVSGGGLTPATDAYVYPAEPAVTGLSPAAGPEPGGTAVTVSGTGFLPDAVVRFGTTVAAAVYTSPTLLTAIAPGGGGTVDVTVQTAGGTSAVVDADRFTYAAAPTVAGIAPSEGPAGGGTGVNVTGTGFEPAGASVVRAVYFGAAPAEGFTVVSDGEIAATSPPGTPGWVDVTVATAGGTSAVGTGDAFTYLAQTTLGPSLAAVSPEAGPAGTRVRLVGSGFGTVPGAVYWSQGETTLRVAPPQSAWSDDAVTTAVPSGLAAGTVSVAVYTNSTGLVSGVLPFQVTVPASPGPRPGSTGGTLITADGACSVTIPAGASPQGGTVTLADSPAAPAGIPQGFVAASPVCVLSGAALQPPVPITIRYDSSAERVSVYAQPSGATGWGFTPTAVNDGEATADATGKEALVVLADTRTFPDVPAGFWAAPSIDALLAAGVVEGFPDGTFRPDAGLTRAAFTKALVLAVGLPVDSGGTSFRDVPPGAWFAPYVAAGVQAGIVTGTSAVTFDPDGAVTREQMAVLLARALKLTGTAALPFSDADRIDLWARSGVQAAVAAGYLEGFPDGSFQPLAPATRAQAAQILALAIRRAAP